MTEPFHIKYRPIELNRVVGQDSVVHSIETLLHRDSLPHAFLFTGPAGTGKTTLARLVGMELGVPESAVTEVDAATNTGIDAMRALTSPLGYKAIGSSPLKMVIVDECHALSRQAWQAVLKVVEEPPEHVFWAFCTTEAGKVPDTIVTRCHSYNLKEVRADVIHGLLEYVASEEGLEIPEAWLAMIARGARGSPRRALVYLSQCRGARDREEVAEILSVPLDDAEIIELARALVRGRGLTFKEVQRLLNSLRDYRPEDIRISVCNYVASVILNSESERGIARLLDILDAFTKPYAPQDGMAPLVLTVFDLTSDKK